MEITEFNRSEHLMCVSACNNVRNVGPSESLTPNTCLEINIFIITKPTPLHQTGPCLARQRQLLTSVNLLQGFHALFCC